ncbi:unnamed protein product [[Actinomadura] parvosata subsp. kistnae]|nr:unnamed protein product [Actinomadura parvosata subsp. kistnae]
MPRAPRCTLRPAPRSACSPSCPLRPVPRPAAPCPRRPASSRAPSPVWSIAGPSRRWRRLPCFGKRGILVRLS